VFITHATPVGKIPKKQSVSVFLARYFECRINKNDLAILPNGTDSRTLKCNVCNDCSKNLKTQDVCYDTSKQRCSNVQRRLDPLRVKNGLYCPLIGWYRYWFFPHTYDHYYFEQLHKKDDHQFSW